MSKLWRWVAPPALFLLCACGARLEAGALLDAQALRTGCYQLLVRTDSPTLDTLVYESAWRRLGTLLPLAESGEFSGAVEVTFTSATGHAPIALGGATGHSSGGWYSGHSSGVQLGLGAAGALTWENSLMTVTVKGASGERLWSATVRRRGGLSLGSTGDAAGARAAGRCLEAVAEELRTQVGLGTPPAT